MLQSRMKFSLALTGLCFGSGIVAAQTVQVVSISKSIDHTQDSASHVIIDSRPPSPTYGGPYGFAAEVSGSMIQGIVPPSVTGPINVTEPFLNGGNLLYNSSDQKWEFGYPNANDFGTTTLSDLNAKFGDGNYNFNVLGANIGLSLTGDLFPTAPTIGLTGGTWAGGKYYIQSSATLTLASGPFLNYGAHVDDEIGIGIAGVRASFQDHSASPSNNTLSMNFAPGSLAAGQIYTVYGLFRAMSDVKPNSSLPASRNFASYDSFTTLQLVVVPEPTSTGLLFLGGIHLLRRRGLSRKETAT